MPSEERRILMYPLDIEEFCYALNENIMIDYIKNCFYEKKPLEVSLHNKAMLLFKQYMLVGGMPKPVIKFIENNKSFFEADKEKRDILALYREDIMKINARYRSKVLTIFDQILGLLSKHERRVVFKEIKEGSQADRCEETFFAG